VNMQHFVLPFLRFSFLFTVKWGVSAFDDPNYLLDG
jgi:hypothetical protein